MEIHSAFTHPTIKSSDLFQNPRSALFSTSPKILLAEDSRPIRMLLRACLVALGCTVHLAEDGLEALKLYEKNDYDLAILDVHMPTIDGIKVAEMIRAHEEIDPDRKTTILIASSSDRSVSAQCIAAGFDACHEKPLLKHTLITVLENWLSSSGK